MYYISKYVVVFLNNIIQQNNKLIKTIDRFETKIHFVNFFKINFFFNNDIFIVQRIKLNIKSQTI